MADEVSNQNVPTDVKVGPCPRCNKDVEYFYSSMEIANGMLSSVLMIIHKPVQCKSCGLRFITVVQGVGGVTFKWQPIPDSDVMLGQDPGDKEARIIVPNRIPKGIIIPS